MLILTRKMGESIIIGGNIKVQILDFSGASVRLGIEAPPNVIVDRQEIHMRRRDNPYMIHDE